MRDIYFYHAELASALAGIKGRFLCSMNDLPETRRLFGNFRLHTVLARYTGGLRHDCKKAELIVTNYELQASLPGLETL